MSVRFRIRTSQGQELSFASAEIFVEFIRSGDLSPDDLVYDGETREWAPARVHPLVLEIEYEREESAGGGLASESSGSKPLSAGDESLAARPSSTPKDEDGTGGREGSSANTLGLELAPPVQGPSPEEERAAFLRKMEAERAMERDQFTERAGGLAGFRMEDAATLGEMIYTPTEPKPPNRPPKPGSARADNPTRRPHQPKRGAVRPKRGEPRERAEVRSSRGGGAFKKVAFFLLLAGAVGVAAYFALARAAAAVVDRPTHPVDPAAESAPTPAAAAVIATAGDVVRDRARERFLTATEELFRGLGPIPDAWLGGEYFALPSDHADVRTVWEEYLEVARDVRAGDRERYRSGFERALDEVGAQGEGRGVQLQQGLDHFDATSPGREAHWHRVEALAHAAIQSHDALLEAEGLVLCDASGVTGRPSGVGAGTSGRDSDAQLLLDQVIELITRALGADGKGPKEGAHVREWVWGGYLDAMTS